MTDRKFMVDCVFGGGTNFSLKVRLKVLLKLNVNLNYAFEIINS